MGKTQDTEKNRCLEADTEEDGCAFPFLKNFRIWQCTAPVYRCATQSEGDHCCLVAQFEQVYETSEQV